MIKCSEVGSQRSALKFGWAYGLTDSISRSAIELTFEDFRVDLIQMRSQTINDPDDYVLIWIADRQVSS